MNSPWYYPSQDDVWDYETPLSEIINECKTYDGSRLKDRYYLQAARAMHAAGNCAECIAFVDSAFSDFPDSNLLKQMATGYAAGCWLSLGECDKANELFAKIGDFQSISCNYSQWTCY